MFTGSKCGQHDNQLHKLLSVDWLAHIRGWNYISNTVNENEQAVVPSLLTGTYDHLDPGFSASITLSLLIFEVSAKE